MRNRNIKINIFLNAEEKNIFEDKVKKSGLNKSEFFRKIILDYQLKEQPDERFYEILSLLRNMANNLNQIQDFVLSMQEVYLISQKKGALNGYNKNMEIQKQTRHPY